MLIDTLFYAHCGYQTAWVVRDQFFPFQFYATYLHPEARIVGLKTDFTD